MAETLGSLCDKLTIVKLKQFHTDDAGKLKSLAVQQASLCTEIDEFLETALSGKISVSALTFDANKVYSKKGNEIEILTGNIGEIFSKLAEINCVLWHEQEKVYEFEKVPEAQKNIVVKSLAILNLQRNQCIDEINNLFKNLVIGATEA
ncbi:MAG: hypothetical protein WDM78_08880 [Puia sp.]